MESLPESYLSFRIDYKGEVQELQFYTELCENFAETY